MNPEETPPQEPEETTAPAEETTEAEAEELAPEEEGPLTAAPTAPEIAEEEEEEELVMEAGGTVVEWELEAEGEIFISGEPRDATGTSACNSLREQGYLPGNVYGVGFEESLPIKLDADQTYHDLVRWRGEDIILELGGEQYAVEVKEVDKDPVSREWQHVDLHSEGYWEEVKDSDDSAEDEVDDDDSTEGDEDDS